MRTLNDSSGVAANCTTSAPSVVSRRSGMRALTAQSSALLQPGKKCANLPPHFRAAGKAAPVGADQSDQLVAFIDGDQIILGRRSLSNTPDTIDQQCAHVVLHPAQNWIRLHDVGPGVQGKQRFRGSRGAWIQGDYFFVQRTLEKKRHLNRNHQSVPLGVRQLKITKEQDLTRNAFVFCPALPLEENRAGSASANQFAAGGLDQVFMHFCEFQAAHFAALDRFPPARKLTKGREGAVPLGWKGGRHISLRSALPVLRARQSWTCRFPVVRGIRIRIASAKHRPLPRQWRRRPGRRFPARLAKWTLPAL